GRASFVPKTLDLEELRRASASCQGCDLYRHATQTVFGRGPGSARAVFVGDAPGAQEALQGAPFVGPAGGQVCARTAPVPACRRERGSTARSAKPGFRAKRCTSPTWSSTSSSSGPQNAASIR